MSFLRGLLAAVLILSAASARAQFSSSGDQTITGQTGVGTATPRATLDVVASSADAYGLWVSSQNGAPLFVVDKTGKVGVGMSNPAALVDVTGGGNADIGMQLRSGNSTATFSSSQILFANDSSGTYSHALVTRAVAGQYTGNEMDFFLWNSTTALPTTVGTLEVLSLQAVPSASTASVHIHPVGTPAYELVVSDGQTTGGGAVMAASVGPHSSRARKTVLSSLSDADKAQAYADVKSLKHARYRYKHRDGASGPEVRGLIYEDSPASVRDERGKSISFDARLANMEMALKVANNRIKELEKKIAQEEKGGGR